MPTILLESQANLPDTPDAGFIRLWSSGTTIKYLTSDGNTHSVATGVTREEVEDILSNSFQDSGSIEWVYDDNNNSFTATVKQSVLDAINAHSLLSNNPHGVTKTQIGLSNVPNVNAVPRSAHTGTQTASTISDFDQAVSDYLDRQYLNEESAYSHTSTTWDWFFDETINVAHSKVYAVTVSYIWSHDNTQSDFEASMLINGINRYELTKQEPQDSSGNIDGFGTDQSHVDSYTLFIPLTAGSNAFRLDFRSSEAGRRAGIRKSTLKLERWEP